MQEIEEIVYTQIGNLAPDIEASKGILWIRAVETAFVPSGQLMEFRTHAVFTLPPEFLLSLMGSLGLTRRGITLTPQHLSAEDNPVEIKLQLLNVTREPVRLEAGSCLAIGGLVRLNAFQIKLQSPKGH